MLREAINLFNSVLMKSLDLVVYREGVQRPLLCLWMYTVTALAVIPGFRLLIVLHRSNMISNKYLSQNAGLFSMAKKDKLDQYYLDNS